MCVKCVKHERPDRGSSMVEKGAYMANFVGCAECKHVSIMLGVSKEERKDTEMSNELKYDHICQQCSHVIAQHWYRFVCTDDQHSYRMVCDLCGEGELDQDIEVDGLE